MRAHRTKNSTLNNGTKSHRLAQCTISGKARYRDRKQARDAINAAVRGGETHRLAAYNCRDCRGVHLERVLPAAEGIAQQRVNTSACAASANRVRRYFLVEIENIFAGRVPSTADLQGFWDVLVHEATGLSEADHVLASASRSFTKRVRHYLDHAQLKWVLADGSPDAADLALINATNVHQLAKRYDELVILSGDHAFAQLARQARAKGMKVGSDARLGDIQHG